MELKINDKIKAAVELDGEVIINMENSSVYESIGKEEAFIYIKSKETAKEIKVRFLKKE
jgi:hypothetical protein